MDKRKIRREWAAESSDEDEECRSIWTNAGLDFDLRMPYSSQNRVPTASGPLVGSYTDWQRPYVLPSSGDSLPLRPAGVRLDRAHMMYGDQFPYDTTQRNVPVPSPPAASPPPRRQPIAANTALPGTISTPSASNVPVLHGASAALRSASMTWTDLDTKIPYNTEGYPGLSPEFAHNIETDDFRRAWGWAQDQLDVRAVAILRQSQLQRRGRPYQRLKACQEGDITVMKLFRGQYEQYVAQEAEQDRFQQRLAQAERGLDAAGLVKLALGCSARQVGPAPAKQATLVKTEVPAMKEPPPVSRTGEPLKAPQKPATAAPRTAAEVLKAPAPAVSSQADKDGFQTVQNKATVKAHNAAERQRKAALLSPPRKDEKLQHSSQMAADSSRWFPLPQGKVPPRGLTYRCGTKMTGRLDYRLYGATEPAMDLNLCAYHFSVDANTRCPHPDGQCFWRHWEIENGPQQKEYWVDETWLAQVKAARIKGKRLNGLEYPPDHFSTRRKYAGLPRWYRNGRVILPGGSIVNNDDPTISAKERQSLDYQIA
ncbi:hypothetical protein ACN47E_002809 [Coniothyrium glycines]